MGPIKFWDWKTTTRQSYTGLPTKNETLKTIVRNLFSQFPCIQVSRPKLAYFCALSLSNQKSSFKSSYFNIITVSSFAGNPGSS